MLTKAKFRFNLPLARKPYSSISANPLFLVEYTVRTSMRKELVAIGGQNVTLFQGRPTGSHAVLPGQYASSTCKVTCMGGMIFVHMYSYEVSFVHSGSLLIYFIIQHIENNDGWRYASCSYLNKGAIRVNVER